LPGHTHIHSQRERDSEIDAYIEIEEERERENKRDSCRLSICSSVAAASTFLLPAVRY